MNVLILGANGRLGHHVVEALRPEHRLRLADASQNAHSSVPEEVRLRVARGGPNEFMRVDISDLDQVAKAAEGMDAIINASVLRDDRRLAFDVNGLGCYNMMTAAVRHGIRRVINTGPHFVVAGPSYEEYDFLLGPDLPPHPGTNLYALSKSLGQEICRVFTESHDIYAVCLLFYNFRYPDDTSSRGQDFTPFTVTWADAAEAVRCALSVDLGGLPSRCEVFNILADIPHQKFVNEKAKRLLGWSPTDQLEGVWRKDVEPNHD